MKLYRKQDLVKILSVFSVRIGDAFFCSPATASKLSDIFYVEDKKIQVGDTIETGYTILMYFENGASLSPHHFLCLNKIPEFFCAYRVVEEESNKN